MRFSIARTFGISRPDLASLRVVAISTIAVTAAVLGVRYMGGLEPLELAGFDQLMRWRLTELEPDSRLLVVAITEEDIEAQQQWPISDQVLAQLLRKLQANQPAVIGLDLYRNLPVAPGYEQLVAQLQQPNLIAVQSIDTRAGVPAPPDVPSERIGFNDVPTDLDSVVRRNNLFAEVLVEGEIEVLYSFSLRLALAYLESKGISPSPDSYYLKLGNAEFLPLDENSGGYQKVDANGYQILLNYRSSQTVARQVTLSEVLNGEVDPSWIKDKIVLIGSIAPSLKDLFATPYSPALKENPKMSGVIIHAQMVSQLLDTATGKRTLFWFWSEWAEVFWIVGWISTGIFLGRVTYHPIALTIGVIGSLSVLSSACFYFFSQGGWVPLAAPALGFVLAVGTVVSYRSYHEHKKQEIVMRLLGQNTSPKIAQALWQEHDRLLKSGKLPGISLTATMLFADIKNFSTISETMSPEALLGWLNELLEVITREVLQHQGIVNKFTGDGVMAAFGVPTARLEMREVSEDAKAAVDCAMTISEHIEEMNQNWQRVGLPIIQMRIGIFTGPVVAGSVGGKDRLEYGIIGDSVNTASRLESYDKERQPTNCRVLIGDATWTHIQGQFEVEDWGELSLKGKQQKVKVFHVLRRLSTKHSKSAASKTNPELGILTQESEVRSQRIKG